VGQFRGWGLRRSWPLGASIWDRDGEPNRPISISHGSRRGKLLECDRAQFVQSSSSGLVTSSQAVHMSCHDPLLSRLGIVLRPDAQIEMRASMVVLSPHLASPSAGCTPHRPSMRAAHLPSPTRILFAASHLILSLCCNQTHASNHRDRSSDVCTSGGKIPWASAKVRPSSPGSSLARSQRRHGRDRALQAGSPRGISIWPHGTPGVAALARAKTGRRRIGCGWMVIRCRRALTDSGQDRQERVFTRVL
jgi:hypothetical protein